MITVFGSINVDLVFQTDHLPEPGETVLCPGYQAVAGGKGANQAVAAARAGGEVRMVGCVGDDTFAELALQDLRGSGVSISDVRRTETPTACASVMVDAAGENSIVVASGANRDTRAAQIPADGLSAGDLLVLQMEVPHEENWLAIKHARNAGVQTMLSVAPAAPVPRNMLDMVDFLLVNEVEGRAVARDTVGSDQGREELPAYLAKEHQCLCVMTVGGDGVIAADSKQEWRIPALHLEKVVDTTGAGDAFAGCLAAAIESGNTIPDALRFATAGAGLSCSVLGAQPSFASAEAILSALP